MTSINAHDAAPRIRIAEVADIPALAGLYADAVKVLGPAIYSPQQVAMWASFAEDLPAFSDFILKPTTFVAEDHTGPLGFCGIELTGHVASLYTRYDSGRGGIASMLLRHAIDHAGQQGTTRLDTRASAFSRPVFEKFGFKVREVETVVRHGVEFSRCIMVRE